MNLWPMKRNIFLYLSLLAAVFIPSFVVFFRSSSHLHSFATDVSHSFLEACQEVGLPAFLVDTHLLNKIQRGWICRSHACRAQESQRAVAFGVIDPPNDKLEHLSNVVTTKTLLYRHVIKDVDPRGVLASSFIGNKTLPIIPLHFLWWSRDGESGGVLRLHVVIFRTRGDYLWHGPLFPAPRALNTSEDRERRGTLPFRMPKDSDGHNAVLINRFRTRKEEMWGLSISVPENIPAFLVSLRDGRMVECNHTMARETLTRYGIGKSFDAKFRQKVLDILTVTAQTLDHLGLPFWLSSGTCLGWYRQCDVIPYTSDVDIEMRIEDYSTNMTRALQTAGLRLLDELGKPTDSFEIRFLLKGLRMDIFFLYEEKDHVWFGMFDPTSYKKYRYVFPKYTLRWAEFGGLRVRVPYPPEQYLRVLYGKEWTKPISSFHWLHGASNKVAAGVWPEKDRANIIRVKTD